MTGTWSDSITFRELYGKAKTDGQSVEYRPFEDAHTTLIYQLWNNPRVVLPAAVLAVKPMESQCNPRRASPFEKYMQAASPLEALPKLGGARADWEKPSPSTQVVGWGPRHGAQAAITGAPKRRLHMEAPAFGSSPPQSVNQDAYPCAKLLL
jgi:hypothetical protein